MYLGAARKNLATFNVLYVGYGDISWMNTLSRVYKDIGQVRFTPDLPEENIGKLIYTDWDDISDESIPTPSIIAQNGQINNNNFGALPTIDFGDIPLVTAPKRRFYLFYGSYQSDVKAKIEATKMKQVFSNTKVVIYGRNFRISIDDYPTLEQAIDAKFALDKRFEDVWIFEF